MLGELLQDLFAIHPRNVTINYDQYSLNSLNGFFDTDNEAYFFKFHQEEGEEAMSGEYYRADILARAGLPVDQPVHMSVLPGEQILVYRRRKDRRLSDVLRELDLKDDPGLRRIVVDAESRLSARVLDVYRESLHPITPEQAADEPINRLFYERLIDPATGAYPGGRLRSFYVGQDFAFPGATMSWEEFADARIVINGVSYQQTIRQLFDGAHERLKPSLLADAGGVVAHGDAHNANVWFVEQGDRAELSFFDPAFAGDSVPTLLAEVKTTFHNILAHPLWLYDPEELEKAYSAQATYQDGELTIETDWKLSPIRADLLRVKAEEAWKPLLQLLKDRSLLPDDWRQVVRYGLFLCPTLVMNLRAGVSRHNPTSSLIGFANAVRAGSEPVAGADLLSDTLDAVTPR
ncbi:MAG: hypothetical protein P0Y65_01370 [Candidatus Devosia phytovorans]|uniref:Uncharacterized protein n=1 Tax=Candidatus Devosia phytovorans TaxID=3121372 RepID=A0AAJ5VYU5_9HYPH|nr:hypothetical protein [Devosia sp.]WEK06700.1 MAG: hypothetical protein P0Y65_01370 [Devosia sp.]